MGMLKFFSEEAKIKREILKRAIKIAEETYQKDVMFKSLEASDLHYAIILDLIKAAQYGGSVTIKLKDGAVIEIKDDTRNSLNQLDKIQTF